MNHAVATNTILLQQVRYGMQHVGNTFNQFPPLNTLLNVIAILQTTFLVFPRDMCMDML